ncbi:transposase [Rhodococcus aetherivorans]
MGAPRKYPEELKERATRLAVEARRDPGSKTGAIKRIADQLGIHPEALRTWVRQAEIDGGVRPGIVTVHWSTVLPSKITPTGRSIPSVAVTSTRSTSRPDR